MFTESREHAPRDSSEAEAGIIKRLVLLFLQEAQQFFSPDSSPGMVIQHATSSTRDALILAFFWRSGINF